MADEQYEKLVGRSLFSVQTCYLGSDHLLVLDGRYRERAKRIRYEDIEAVLICPTKSGGIFSLISALVGFILLIVALSNAGSSALWVWMTLAVICWVVFGLGIYGKGSALMGIQTAVQTIQLEGVSNLRKAWKVGRRLNQRIRSVQGELTAEQIEAFKSQRRPKPTLSATPPPLSANPPPPLTPRADQNPASPPDPLA